MEFVWQISYPPVNGARLGNSLVPKMLLKHGHLIYSASPEIIGVKVRHRRTDGRTDRQRDKFLTQYMGGCVFFSPVEIFYLPTRFARRGIIFVKILEPIQHPDHH